jgi:hypothetical protein
VGNERLTEDDHLYYNCKCIKYHIAQMRLLLHTKRRHRMSYAHHSSYLTTFSDRLLRLSHPALTMYYSVLAPRPLSAPSPRPNGLQASHPHQPTIPLFSFLPPLPPLSSLYHVLPYYISKYRSKWILLRSISRRL